MTDTPDEETASALARLEDRFPEWTADRSDAENTIDGATIWTLLKHIAALTAERDRIEDDADRMADKLIAVSTSASELADRFEAVAAERDALTARLGQLEAGLDALLTAQAWLDRWAEHVGSCAGRTGICTCGLARVRLEVNSSVAALDRAGGAHEASTKADSGTPSILSPASAGQREGRE